MPRYFMAVSVHNEILLNQFSKAKKAFRQTNVENVFKFFYSRCIPESDQ